MEKEILELLAILMKDNIWRQVYSQQIKLLFDMLEREQKTYLGNNFVVGDFDRPSYREYVAPINH